MVEAGLPDIKSRVVQPPAKEAGAYKPLLAGQTVCTVKDEKGESCHGHVKRWYTAPPEVAQKAAPGNVIYRCQRCNTIYEGPPREYLHPNAHR